MKHRPSFRRILPAAALAPLVLTLTLALATPALADDLREALTSAYNTNPTLQAARANQRATDEGVPLARARGLPSLQGQASYIKVLRANPNDTMPFDARELPPLAPPAQV